MNTLTSLEQSHHKKHYTPVSYERNCQCCGKKFIAHNIRKRYCSDKCKDVAYKKSKGQDSKIEPFKRKCVICGKEFETFYRKQKTCSDKCSKELKKERDRNNSRYEHTLEEYKRILKEKSKQRQKVKEIEKKWYIANHTVERECKYCGSLFYCLDNQSNQYCSEKCKKRMKYNKTDKRIPKEQIIDKDINLKKLYRRDGGICWICGKQCDFNSIAISAKGNEYPGLYYPEIEHVVPISRGGLHSWDNVRLAHRICNAQKSDNLYPYVPLDIEFAYKEKKSSSKKTIQKTIEGKIVKIWESTAQIKRELGYNDKRIQNVCRGEGKSAYGYKWEYI